MSWPPASGRVGRPRNVDLDDRILDCAIALLQQADYEQFSMDAVAEHAGCAKPAIYRRWRSKDDLIIAALARTMPDMRVAATGNLRTDLVRLLRRLLGWNHVAELALMPRLTVGGPALLAKFRERIVAPRRAAVLRLLHEAVERGALDARQDLELTADVLLGAPFLIAVMATLGVTPRRSQRKSALRLADFVLAGLGVNKPTQAPTPTRNQSRNRVRHAQ